jgi:hypothetical protein
VSGFSDEQLAVARTLFALPEAAGYALAGGSALLALGVIDRPTRDVDAFVPAIAGTPPGDVTPLLTAFQRQMAEDGWTVTVERALTTFARLVVDQGDDEVEIDLAVDSPPLFPLEAVLDLPVLAGPDLAARKVLTVVDRAEGRDFTDLRALAGLYSQAECIEWAQQLDDGLRPADIARAFRTLDRLDEDDLPCPADEIDELREWYRRWAEHVVAASE